MKEKARMILICLPTRTWIIESRCPSNCGITVGNYQCWFGIVVFLMSYGFPIEQTFFNIPVGSMNCARTFCTHVKSSWYRYGLEWYWPKQWFGHKDILSCEHTSPYIRLWLVFQFWHPRVLSSLIPLLLLPCIHLVFTGPTLVITTSKWVWPNSHMQWWMLYIFLDLYHKKNLQSLEVIMWKTCNRY